MSLNRLMSEIDSIIEDAKAAILATVDEKGVPKLRWITPGTIPEHPGALYMVTNNAFDKVEHARNHPDATIMLQTRVLDKVLTLHGTLEVLENPAIRSDTLERVGKRLTAFWKIPAERKGLVVLEFSITRAVLYLPQKGIKTEIPLNGEGV